LLLSILLLTYQLDYQEKLLRLQNTPPTILRLTHPDVEDEIQQRRLCI
jgi:hypothetical protein